MNPRFPVVQPRLATLFFALVLLAVMANAIAFTASTANPVIASDNWFFLDRVVIPYAHGAMQPTDLLLKRGALDHSQPLQRLLLIANYEWFDLDLRAEAVFAVLTGALSLLLLGWLARRELAAGGTLARLGYVTLAAVYFSLSATMVFTWSLVTLGYLTNLALFVWLAVVWRSVSNARATAVGLAALATLVLGIVADDTGLIAVIAASAACLWHGFRTGAWRGAIGTIAALVAGYLAYSMFYRALAPAMPPAVGAGLAFDPGHSLQVLQAGFGDAWQWVVVPLTQSLVHRMTLVDWFGAAADNVVIAIAALLALGHAWFWAKALRGRVDHMAFMAIALMLLFYGWVAGIVLARVPEFGVGYLWQPRYASIYRMHVVALLLMLIAQAPAMRPASSEARPGSRPARAAAFAFPVVLSAVLLFQLPLAVVAWRSAPSIDRWNENMARQLHALARDPAHAPSACVPQLKLCHAPPADRVRIATFLSDQRLSVFSPAVQARDHLPAGP